MDLGVDAPAGGLPRRQVGQGGRADHRDACMKQLAQALCGHDLLRSSQELLSQRRIQVVRQITGSLGRGQVEAPPALVRARCKPPRRGTLRESMENVGKPPRPWKAGERRRILGRPGEPRPAQAAPAASAAVSSVPSSARTSRAARSTSSVRPMASRDRGAPPSSASSVHSHEARVQPFAGRSGS